MDIHKWSSVEFPEELALIYTSLTDKSKHSIFRLSFKPEKVLLKLVNSLCDAHPKRALKMEVTAQKDNFGYFNFEAVKVITDDTSKHNEFNVFHNKYLSNVCEKESCFYEVMRKVGSISSVEKVNWEFCQWYSVNGATHITYNVIIECDKRRGLRAELRGPFKCTRLVKDLKSEVSLTLREVNRKPTEEALRKSVEGEIKGKEYILFGGGSEQRVRVVNIVNTGATFNGGGNGSKYENCHIVMNSNFSGFSP